MISRIARLRAKKGFTVIEMVVVISIIGILLAMIIPIVSYDRKPAVARTMAKEIYYRSAAALYDCKAADVVVPTDPSAHDTCFYAEVDSLGNPSETGLFYIDNRGVVVDTEIFTTANVTGIRGKMKSMFENYVTDEVTVNMSGHLIVVVDSHHRVVGSYWVENFDTTMGMEGFNEDNILNTGDFCTAYPSFLSLTGARLFYVGDVTGVTV